MPPSNAPEEEKPTTLTVAAHVVDDVTALKAQVKQLEDMARTINLSLEGLQGGLTPKRSIFSA